MKLERINENQIRCTLTGEDLMQRGLTLGELSYGTEKARALFRDMMQKAFVELGFDVENIPLMVEAVPLSRDSIVLIVTKVEDPEELDTRFASFAPSVMKEVRSDQERVLSPLEQLLMNAMHGNFQADDMRDEESEGEKEPPKPRPQPQQAAQDEQEAVRKMRRFMYTHRLFRFGTLTGAAQAARAAQGNCPARSSLYEAEDARAYYLILVFEKPSDVNRSQPVLAGLSEYGETEPMTYAREQHVKEHCRVIIERDALEKLREI